MKKKLKELGAEDRHIFRARIVKFGERPKWSKFEPTIVLENVKLWPANQRVINHLWFFLGKNFLQAGNLEPRDWIEFEARAVVRRTGYRGPDQRLRRAYRGRTKWTLTRPTKVRKVNPNEMAFQTPLKNELVEPQKPTETGTTNP